MKNIIALVGFKGPDKKIIETAANVASVYGAKLWLLHLAAPEPEFVGFGVGPQHERDHRAKTLLEERNFLQQKAHLISEQGIEAQPLLFEGDIYDLQDKLKELGGDMVVLGNARHSAMYDALVGSVLNELMDKCPIPLLTIPIHA